MKNAVAAVVAVTACATAVAWRAEGASEPATGRSPQPRSHGSVTWLTGGVGLEERDAIREQAGEYNLWVWFARSEGGYFLADVEVNIEDAHGQRVLDTRTDGPWLLARVPPGRYVIRTDQQGAATSVSVPKGSRAVTILRFPGDD